MKGASRNLPTLFYAPRRFFQARAEDQTGSLAATGFALAFGFASSTLEWTWYRLGWSLQNHTAVQFGTLSKYLLTQVGFLPLVLLLEAFAIHVLLYGLSFARASFGATYRVCAYSQAGVVFSVLPLVGAPLGVVAGFTLLVIGIRETHRLSVGGAILVTSIGLIRLILVAVAGLGLLALLRRL